MWPLVSGGWTDDDGWPGPQGQIEPETEQDEDGKERKGPPSPRQASVAYRVDVPDQRIDVDISKMASAETSQFRSATSALFRAGGGWTGPGGGRRAGVIPDCTPGCVGCGPEAAHCCSLSAETPGQGRQRRREGCYRAQWRCRGTYRRGGSDSGKRSAAAVLGSREEGESTRNGRVDGTGRASKNSVEIPHEEAWDGWRQQGRKEQVGIQQRARSMTEGRSTRSEKKGPWEGGMAR